MKSLYQFFICFCSKNVVRKRRFLRGKKKFNMDPKKVSLHDHAGDVGVVRDPDGF